MTMRKKLLITIACLSVILCTLVTGTIAWLIDDTQTIVNEFKPSNIDVDLTETKGDFKMVPGAAIEKDPKVTVDTDIPCYVFVKVEENLGAWSTFATDGKNFKSFLDYSIISDWTAVPGTTDVYYFEAYGDTDKSVLVDDKVTVSGDNVTKKMMETLYSNGTVISNLPTLKFTAYACQMENGNTIFTPEQAWEIAKPATP